jgi:hypothetical protein
VATANLWIGSDGDLQPLVFLDLSGEGGVAPQGYYFMYDETSEAILHTFILDPYHPEEGPMTPVLAVLTFLLLLDVLVLLGAGHDSRDGRDWQPRASPSPDRATVTLV